MKLQKTELEILVAALNVIDPHNIFLRLLKEKIIRELRENQTEEGK
jgi:hypothetical protein